MAASPPLPSSSSSSLPGGSTGSYDVYDTSEETTNGLKLFRLLKDGGADVLRKVINSFCLSKPLHNELKKKEATLKKKIFPEQCKTLFPSSGGPPDLTKFDITLLHLLIRELCNLPERVQENVNRIKCFRNQVFHSGFTAIPTDEFEDMWDKIASSIESIESEVCRQNIERLKKDPIDHTTRQLVKKEVEQWRKLQEQEEIEPISQLGSYLPDMPQQESMFGRSEELHQVREHVKSGTVSVVLITGGPGFGKTTLAKSVAHDLAKPENGKTVLYCRLVSKKTFNEVATEMILHSCGKIRDQLPEHPDHWLKDWSKQIQTQVTFVLDNADDVLESEEKKPFLRILSEMRKLSQKRVTFVITSRKLFEDPDLPSKEVKLRPLLSEQAQKVLVSRVKDEVKLSKTKEIVELCGYVPLALCIVGSLLSDYTEEKLIKCLKEEPMTVLEDGNASFPAAIKTSFDLLTKAEQDALILMSIFPGSFNCDAAGAVIKACTEFGAQPVSIFRSLKNRSLVEQAITKSFYRILPPAHRYQLHPLIRSFAKDQADQGNGSRLLDKGKKLACAHFMSRLEQFIKKYSRSYPWLRNDTEDLKSVFACRDLFDQDRENFKHFLEMFDKGMEIHDPEIEDICETFDKDFLRNSGFTFFHDGGYQFRMKNEK